MAEMLNRDNGMLKALEAIQTENQKLQNILQEIVCTRKALEANLDSVEDQLSSFLQEEHKLQSIHAINSMKIQIVEKEVYQFEDKQKATTENILNLNGKIKEYKENLDSKISNFTKEAEHLCELFLSTVNNETAELECLKIFDKINNLKLEIGMKEETLVKIKRDLEEFAFFEMHDDPTEFSVTVEEREVLMNVMENQFLSATHQLEELNHLKSAKQYEEFQWAQQC